MGNVFVKQTMIDGARVEVYRVESWRGSYYHATAKKGKFIAVNTGQDADACAETAAACVEIRIEAARQRKEERNASVDIPSPFVDPKLYLVDPKEDAEDYKRHFTGLPKRAELSEDAKRFGYKSVIGFIFLLTAAAMCILSLPN